jgi:signal transduction histidine kinase
VSQLTRGSGSDRPRTVVDVQPPELTVWADRERLHQVAANLLDNAIRHSPPGGVVTLRARPLDSGVRIEVADQGPGIPPGERVRVFDRFDRGSRQAADGGTGLGLAIARWVVDLHGGRISVAEPGEDAGPAAEAEARNAKSSRKGDKALKAANDARADSLTPESVAGAAVESVTSDTADAAAEQIEQNELKPAPGCVIRVDLP